MTNGECPEVEINICALPEVTKEFQKFMNFRNDNLFGKSFG
jgi:hypothetical protein